jgi:hypothetical protein
MAGALQLPGDEWRNEACDNDSEGHIVQRRCEQLNTGLWTACIAPLYLDIAPNQRPAKLTVRYLLAVLRPGSNPAREILTK